MMDLIGSVSKSSDPKRWKRPWAYQYRDRNKKQHRPWFATEREAKKEQLRISIELGKGIHTPRHSSVTVADAAADWLEQCERDGLAPGTMVGYRDYVDRYIVPKPAPEPKNGRGAHLRRPPFDPELGLADIKLADLTHPKVKEFVDDVTTAASKKTARRVLFALRAILNLAAENGKVAQNVAMQVRIKLAQGEVLGPGKVGIDRMPPTAQEVAELLAAARPAFRPMLMTAAFTGLRWGELRALTWDCVDFDRNVIVVKRSADSFGNIKRPKTAKSTREVPMSPMLGKGLREHKLSCPRTGGLAGFNATEEKVLQLARIIEEHKAYGKQLGRPGAPRDENGRFARVGERDWHGRLLPSGNLTQRGLAKLVRVNKSAVIRVRKALREGVPLTPTGRLHFVFPTRFGGLRSAGSIAWELRELQRNLGMIAADGAREGKPKYVPHRTRHYFASWGIKEGWAPKILQAYLGHATITQTFDTYGHMIADPEGDRERFTKSDEAFLAAVSKARGTKIR